MNQLDELQNAYNNAPEIFHATRYWRAYEQQIIKEVKKADINELRSGKYPIFGTFGYNEAVYYYHPNMPWYKKLARKIIRKLFITNKASLPYSIKLSDIRELAYKHCVLQGRLSNAQPIGELEVSSFGNPQDLFVIRDRKYTMQFLNFYLRYCFAHEYLKLKGDEIIVELGSGSGFQVEVLKKAHPNLTILCFDLPAQLYLCENYLANVFGEAVVRKSANNLELTSLANLEKGKIHMFGNWQFPLLTNYSFDIFWNAASFGEMEPAVVTNYLSYVKNNCSWIYLLQARQGKESSQAAGVVQPIDFASYNRMLAGYQLVQEADAFEAHRRMSQTGGYFQGVWQLTINNEQ